MSYNTGVESKVPNVVRDYHTNILKGSQSQFAMSQGNFGASNASTGDYFNANEEDRINAIM